MWLSPAAAICLNVSPFTNTTLHAIQQLHVAVTSCSHLYECFPFTITTLHAVQQHHVAVTSCSHLC